MKRNEELVSSVSSNFLLSTSVLTQRTAEQGCCVLLQALDAASLPCCLLPAAALLSLLSSCCRSTHNAQLCSALLPSTQTSYYLPCKQ